MIVGFMSNEETGKLGKKKITYFKKYFARILKLEKNEPSEKWKFTWKKKLPTAYIVVVTN